MEDIVADNDNQPDDNSGYRIVLLKDDEINLTDCLCSVL
jgi:hypothetical protein